MQLNEITEKIIGAAMKVHSAIGPGVLESVYRKCLQHELKKFGFEVQSEVKLPIMYEGMVLESGYRLDLLVENRVVVELKCVEALLPIQSTAINVFAIGK